MKNIPNKELSEKQVKIILSNYKINSGGESTICESDKSYTLYKIFTKDNSPIEMSDNKEKKIVRLHELDIEHSTKPISTISMNGKLIGYEMLNHEDYRTYKLYELMVKKQILIQYLKQVREILDYFSKKEIIYADMYERNILFNIKTGDIIFCDMDNVQIEELGVDMFPLSIAEYRMTRGLDDGIHPFLHNKMLLRAFNLDEYFITNKDIFKLFRFGTKKIINTMMDPEEFDDKYLIDYLKKLK